jgi:hypothetical protein
MFDLLIQSIQDEVCITSAESLEHWIGSRCLTVFSVLKDPTGISKSIKISPLGSKCLANVCKAAIAAVRFPNSINDLNVTTIAPNLPGTFKFSIEPS